jgi:hypothetical protein
MLILKFNNRTIDTFEKKIDMFKNVFFSALSSIDLIDISRFFYFNLIECFSSITKTKVFTIIKRFAFDKISSFDNFINKLLKACAFIMIKLLTFLFKICIQLFYHSKTFKKINTNPNSNSKIHIVWNKNTNQIVILLSLDVIETFDTILPERLIHDLRKRRISKWIID